MTCCARQKLRPWRQNGAILLTVVFIMVVLGLVAAFLTRSLGAQHAQASLDHLSMQARFAAASGIEWGRGRALSAGLCSSGQITVAEFTVSVSCDAAAVTEGAVSYNVYDISAEARHGSYGDVDFVRRSLERRVTDR
jgi:MSHA biogenesis protein MshP